MFNIYKFLIYIVLTLFLLSGNYDCTNSANAATKTKSVATSTAYLAVSPLDVVACPEKFLNKNVTFNAEFVAFTSLGLDYKPAYRDANKYIGVLVKRPDVTDHTIPLSEMKMFISRDDAEKHVEIEAGDKIKISGKVFSTALGDPWLDIKVFDVLTSKKEITKK